MLFSTFVALAAGVGKALASPAPKLATSDDGPSLDPATMPKRAGPPNRIDQALEELSMICPSCAQQVQFQAGEQVYDTPGLVVDIFEELDSFKDTKKDYLLTGRIHLPRSDPKFAETFIRVDNITDTVFREITDGTDIMAKLQRSRDAWKVDAETGLSTYEADAEDELVPREFITGAMLASALTFQVIELIVKVTPVLVKHGYLMGVEKGWWEGKTKSLWDELKDSFKDKPSFWEDLGKALSPH